MLYTFFYYIRNKNKFHKAAQRNSHEEDEEKLLCCKVGRYVYMHINVYVQYFMQYCKKKIRVLEHKAIIMLWIALVRLSSLLAPFSSVCPINHIDIRLFTTKPNQTTKKTVGNIAAPLLPIITLYREEGFGGW